MLWCKHRNNKNPRHVIRTKLRVKASQEKSCTKLRLVSCVQEKLSSKRRFEGLGKHHTLPLSLRTVDLVLLLSSRVFTQQSILLSLVDILLKGFFYIYFSLPLSGFLFLCFGSYGEVKTSLFFYALLISNPQISPKLSTDFDYHFPSWELYSKD